MTNINEVLDVFTEQVSRFRNEVSKALADLNQKNEQLIADRASIVKRSEELDARDTEIKKVEDMISLSAEVKDNLQEVKKASSALIAEKDNFDNYKSEALKNLNIQTKELEEKEKYIQKEYQNLKKAQEELKAEKSSFKDKVAKSIVDLANKK